ncbi:NAD(P)-dependent oxidoreductase [Rhodococcus sp. Q]|uniref:NAD(P)-dependent oxidoreductase n=1 Tax=Rhodococcus sp. Q TaxID=2502252 RepID=UPI0010F8CD0A|nr:NAD(P)-dependent oxidoreductase [Rhodococcus sp. Q]
MRVGFIGAGRMGAPMVRRLVDAGHAVNVLARTDGNRAAVADLGATPVSDTAAVAADADVVVVCVFTDDQVQRVCLDGPLLTEMAPGSTLVLHTTGSPRTAEAIAARARLHDVHVVDAPVSGGPHDIAAGTLTVFAGGDTAAVDRARPVLTAYSHPVLHVGAIGNGQRVKLVNNALFAANIGLIAEAVRLAGQLGVDESSLLSALPHASGASRALAGVSSRGSVSVFTESVGDFLRKDIDVVRKTVADLGGSLGVLDDAIEAQSR